MPWIQNVSSVDLQLGHHIRIDPGNSVLIQICDPLQEFPQSLHGFTYIHQFYFLDAEESCGVAEEFKIADAQAKSIASILRTALEKKADVVVQCGAGRCRSGAVVEIGVMLGFQDAEAYRQPNLLVKKKLLAEVCGLKPTDNLTT